MKLQLAKGVNDSLPEEMIVRQKLIDELKTVFELYGYSPLDTPAIERFDVLSSKYAGGAEILKETFKFNDQGKRELALRYDLTVPFARVVGMNPNLKMPFKRYQIGKVWRDGPIGMGRYREFWQCDVDMVGISKMSAEGELLSMAKTVFEKFGLKYNIKLNNRKILNGMLESIGRTEDKMDIILIIDKMEKISKDDLVKELKDAGLNKKQIDSIYDVFAIQGTNKQKLAKVKEYVKDEEGLQGIKEIEDLFAFLKAYEVKNFTFELTLTRGLAFYTGTVFETVLTDSKIKSSVAGGGRYDEIIPKFLNTKIPFPCVGISFGLSRIADAITELGNTKKTVTEVFVVPIGLDKEAIPIVNELRGMGIKAEIELGGRKVPKSLKYASALEIPYVIMVGENELKAGKFKFRNVKTGEDQNLTLKAIAKKVLN